MAAIFHLSGVFHWLVRQFSYEWTNSMFLSMTVLQRMWKATYISREIKTEKFLIVGFIFSRAFSRATWIPRPLTAVAFAKSFTINLYCSSLPLNFRYAHLFIVSSMLFWITQFSIPCRSSNFPVASLHSQNFQIVSEDKGLIKHQGIWKIVNKYTEQ